MTAGKQAGLHHAAHATHTAHAAHIRHTSGRLVVGCFTDHGFGGDHQAADRGRRLQGRTGDLSRIEDTHLDHVAIHAGRRVVDEVASALLDLVDHYARLVAGVGDDLAQRRLHGTTQQGDADVLIFVVALQLGDGLQGAHQGYTAARHHAFFHCRAGRVQGVFDAGFLLFHLDFGAGTDLDHGNTASQLGQTLLQLLLVVVGGGVFDLLADLCHARFDVGLLAGAVDDGGVFLAQHDALGITQVLQGSAFQAQADFFGNHGTAGEDGDVLQHGLAPIAEARRLDGRDLDDATHVVDHQGGQGFAFDVFGHDQQRTAGFGHGLQHRQHFADVGDLLVDQQDQRGFQLGDHGVGLVDEVRRQVATVELHAFDDRQFVFQTRTFLDCDHAFFTDFFHGFGNDVADGAVGVGGDGADLGDRLAVGARLGQVLQLGDDGDGGLVDAALEVHRVHAGSNGLQTFADDGLGQYGGGGGAVAGFVVGLGGYVLDQLRAHVLEAVFQLDFLGNGNAVLGDGRSAEALLKNHVTAFRAEGRFNRVSQDVYTGEHFLAGGVAELNFFSSHDGYSSKFVLVERDTLWRRRKSGFDNGQDFALAHDQQLFAVDLDGIAAGVRTKHHFVTDLDGQRAHFAVVQHATGAYRAAFALVRLLGSGTRQPDAACGFGLFFAATDHDAVMQRTKLHCRSLPNRLFTSAGVHTSGLAKSGGAGCAAPEYNAEVCSAETGRKPCGDRYIRAYKGISRVSADFFCCRCTPASAY